MFKILFLYVSLIFTNTWYTFKYTIFSNVLTTYHNHLVKWCLWFYFFSIKKKNSKIVIKYHFWIARSEKKMICIRKWRWNLNYGIYVQVFAGNTQTNTYNMYYFNNTGTGTNRIQSKELKTILWSVILIHRCTGIKLMILFHCKCIFRALSQSTFL